MSRLLHNAALVLSLTLGTSALAIAQTTTPTPPPAAHAGHHGHHHHDAAEEAQHLAKKLNLNADQTTQVQTILADRQQRMQDLRSGTTDKKAMHEQRHTIMQDTDSKLKAVLNPAQQEQFATMKAKHHHKHGEHAPTA